jgi:hypothetical protein
MLMRGQFRGFQILSKGRSGGFGLLQDDERVPELFIRGRATYSRESDQSGRELKSIAHTPRSLEKQAAEQHAGVARTEKEFVDCQAQADRPFEDEARLKSCLPKNWN